MEQEKDQPVETTEQPKAEPAAKLESQAEQSAPPASDETEEFDKDRAMETIKKLREIEKNARKNEKELARLKAEEQKRLDAQLTETDRLKKERDELAQEAAKLRSAMMRRDVIAETGLPPALADRLKGETQEELLADAQELLKLLPKQKNTQSPTNPGDAKAAETEAQKKERLLGSQSADIFSMDYITRGGGGVTSFKE